MERLVDALNSHDLDRYLACYAADFRYELVGVPPIQDSKVLGQIVENLNRAFPNERFTADYVVADDSHAVFVGRWSGKQSGELRMTTGQTLPPTERNFDTWIVMAIESKNGKIVRHQDFFDRTDLVRQLTGQF